MKGKITLTDLSGNGRDGIINGATWTGEFPKLGCMDPYADNYDPEANVNSRFCYGYPENGEFSLNFDGVDDYVNLGTNSYTEINGDISIAAWVKFDSFDSNNGAIISKVSEGAPVAYGIEKKGSQNRIGFWIGDGNSFNEVFSPELSLNTWYYVVGINDGSESKLYIDGEFVASAPSGHPAGPTGDLNIGVHSFLLQSGRFWHGSIDNVSLWNIVLSESDILHSYYNGPDNYQNGLVANWKFNEGSDQLLYDHSGNSNHGTIIGPSWTEDIPYRGPWFVSTSGDDNAEGSLGSPLRTIQKAINKAGDGNEIIVEPGTYIEKLTANNKSFILRSSSSNQGNYDGIGHENSDVIIQGNYDGSVFSLSDGTYHLEGVTVRYGRFDQGGGINVSGAELMLINCLIESNQTAGSGSDGAGIYARNTFLNIDHTTIKNNNATNENGDPGSGAGIFITNDDSESNLEISNSIIENNVSDGGSGGGIV